MKHFTGRRLLSFFLVLALLLALAPAALADESGTGDQEGDGTPEGEAPAIPVTYTLDSVTISPPSISMKVGETRSLSATVTLSGSDGSTSRYSPTDPLPAGCQLEIIWEVTNQRGDEAEVIPTGLNAPTATLTAREVADTPDADDPLTVQVSVRLNGAGDTKTAACTVTISPSEPTGLTVSPTTMEVAPGGTDILTAAVTPSTASQSVTWSSDDTAIATVVSSGENTATVTGVAAGETTVYAKSSAFAKEASCLVTVWGVVLDQETLEIRVGDRQELPYTVYGDTIEASGVNWTTSDPAVVRVESGYIYGVGEGTATVTVRVNGYSDYYDVVSITVKKGTAAVIPASAGVGSPLSFATLRSQFRDRAASVLDGSLSFISGLSVPTSQGTLYYQYTSEGDTGAGVGSSERYYVNPGSGQMGLSEITFVPKGTFSGTAVISYTGYASVTSFFQGTVEVAVEAQRDVTYTTANGEAIQFNADDFYQVCQSRTGRELKYVTFSLPDSSIGTLTYQYLSSQSPGTAVRASTQYYYTGSPALGNVYFVPADGFDGKAIITYTGWDTNRQSFQGSLVIQVEGESGSGSIQYDGAQGSDVAFDDSDFQSLCRDLTGSSLDYVSFKLPASSQGVLYYGSTASSSGRVTETQRFYRSAAPRLDDVFFRAGEDFSGTVSIPFTGWSTGGAAFSGTVLVRVGGQAEEISYQVSNGSSVEFSDNDFNTAARAVTGESLRYVRFTLPASSQGTLYYDNGNYASKVSASGSYYTAQSPYLDQVSFVPAASFTGTVSIPFTGWTTEGSRFTGTVKIQVTDAGSASEIVYTTTYRPVTFRASDFNTACAARGLGTLVSVRFTATSVSGAGRLYSQYSGVQAANSEVRAGTLYYPGKSPDLSSLTFVPRVGYQGTVTLTYTGTDSQNRTFQGRVRIVVSPNTASAYFADVSSGYGWAAPAVDFLYESGVVNGTGAGQFSPSRAITRGSFLAMVDRALSLPHTTTRDFPDVPEDSYYAGAIQAAYGLGIVDGYSDGTFRPDAPLTRAAASAVLYRAMQAVGWSIGSENTALLDSYPDGGSVPAYARGALSVLLQAGILTGTSAGKLEPGRIMTRAEMAVVLARALTL